MENWAPSASTTSRSVTSAVGPPSQRTLASSGEVTVAMGQVRSGALVPVGGHALKLDDAFYVVWPRSRDLNGPARRVRDWLVEEGRVGRGDAA